jgi:hypothetical protein
MTASLTIDQAAAVDLDSNSRGQIVGDQEFVDWVFQGIEGAAGLQEFAIQRNLSPPKIAVDAHSFIRSSTEY